ncbi:MAG: RecQ family ATP-dependent DNA helicase [Deltaproteobacteria bacterium]|nr:RecQ family ATP-dependent DNA helicase [Deltaproteobacteria bacterium]
MHKTLKKHFGYDRFREGQEAVISAIINGRSSAAIFPTGSGKSLCYQLPALHLEHLTLVISPLLALMQDQLDFLKSKNIPAASIDSTQSREEASTVMEDVRQGRTRILMISVERLKNEHFRNFIVKVPISLLVVDEAHCISEWGHNFRPDYLKLPDYQKAFNIPQALLLTATATPRVIEDMSKKFSIDKEQVVRTGFYRPNLNLSVEPAEEKEKDRLLSNWLDKRKEEPTIVYVTLQQTAEHVAKKLASYGIKARAYHAGMKSEVREEVQLAFMQGKTNCIVATIAFGMGIDKSNIRNIIHYDLPKSIESYSQEIGRAGRDGRESNCLVLAKGSNLNVLENFIYGDTPEKEGILKVLAEIKAAHQNWETRIVSLSASSNIRQLPLKTLLVYLEMKQVIKPLYSYFSEIRFKLLIAEEELIDTFKGERRDFVQSILKGSQKAKIWYTLDFETLYEQYGAERSRVVTALEYFHDKGYVFLESKQMTDVYEVLTPDLQVDSLAEALFRHFKEKERTEIKRIASMVRLFESDKCINGQLSVYFGDEKAPERCGHCSVCKGQVAAIATEESLAPLSEVSFNKLIKTFFSKLNNKPSTDMITRFLCGIPAPQFSSIKARSLPGFGTLSSYRYHDVLKWVNNHGE